LPFTVVVTSALAVACDLQPPFGPLVALEELLDEDDAFADADELSADAIRMSALMAINPPIVPAATSSGQPLDCNLRIARSFSKTHTNGRPGIPAARLVKISGGQARRAAAPAAAHAYQSDAEASLPLSACADTVGTTTASEPSFAGASTGTSTFAVAELFDAASADASSPLTATFAADQLLAFAVAEPSSPSTLALA
jgi:hypothetical protein